MLRDKIAHCEQRMNEVEKHSQEMGEVAMTARSTLDVLTVRVDVLSRTNAHCTKYAVDQRMNIVDYSTRLAEVEETISRMHAALSGRGRRGRGRGSGRGRGR